MIKYKLIKCYPGSPGLGTIVKKHDENYYKIDNTISGLRSKSKIENYPEFWQKVEEKVLFTTEDEVDIFKGDKYFTVSQDYLIGGKIAGKKSIDILNTFEIFSTKEKAEEFIYQNKPRFSFEDISYAWEKMTLQYNSLEISDEKLNQSLEKNCL